jgi:hypothetical protein
MIDTERLMLIPARMDEGECSDRPYRQMCVAAVSAALDMQVALEIAISRLARDTHKTAAPARKDTRDAAAA